MVGAGVSDVVPRFHLSIYVKLLVKSTRWVGVDRPNIGTAN